MVPHGSHKCDSGLGHTYRIIIVAFKAMFCCNPLIGTGDSAGREGGKKTCSRNKKVNYYTTSINGKKKYVNYSKSSVSYTKG